MTRCTAIKPNGERCKGRAIQGSEWCWNHDPAHADERRRHGSRGGKRGGRGRPVSELWLDRLQRGGVAIMLMMMSLALYNDMARLLGLQ